MTVCRPTCKRNLFWLFQRSDMNYMDICQNSLLNNYLIRHHVHNLLLYLYHSSIHLLKEIRNLLKNYILYYEEYQYNHQ